jgi:Rho-binding antiterminator
VTKIEGPPTATQYQPISCDVYSRLELAIVRREQLRLSWKQGNVCFNQPVVPIDLETLAGEEFLHCRLHSGERARVRLDYIDRMGPA